MGPIVSNRATIPRLPNCIMACNSPESAILAPCKALWRFISILRDLYRSRRRRGGWGAMVGALELYVHVHWMTSLGVAPAWHTD